MWGKAEGESAQIPPIPCAACAEWVVAPISVHMTSGYLITRREPNTIESPGCDEGAGRGVRRGRYGPLPPIRRTRCECTCGHAISPRHGGGGRFVVRAMSASRERRPWSTPGERPPAIQSMRKPRRRGECCGQGCSRAESSSLAEAWNEEQGTASDAIRPRGGTVDPRSPATELGQPPPPQISVPQSGR